MAKADSVPSSTRQLITGESANQSTNLRAANLRAANLPAVKVKPANRPSLIGGSHDRVVLRRDEASLLKCRHYAGQAPVDSDVEALFYANVAFFLGRLLRRIVQILLRFVSRNKRLRNSALDPVSSNQLVRSSPQERLQ